MKETTIEKRCQRGDVYWFDLSKVYNGYRGSIQSGIRPVLVVQNDMGNSYSSTVLVASLTSSKSKNNLPTHSKITNGLKYESTMLGEQIFTVLQEDLGHYICHISGEELSQASKALAVSLAL